MKDLAPAWVAPGSAVLCMLSVLALLGVLKLNALIRLQRKRAGQAMARYEAAAGQTGLSTISRDAHALAGGGWSAKLSLGVLWSLIFAVLLAANLAILSVALMNLGNPVPPPQ
jgi:hypothetical protein